MLNFIIFVSLLGVLNIFRANTEKIYEHIIGKPVLDEEGVRNILHYIDTLSNPLNVLVVQCKVPLANNYEWKVDAKSGSPFAGSIRLSGKNDDLYEPWKYTINDMQYPHEMILVRCTPRLDLTPLIRFLFFITRAKSNSDKPYHPIICEYPGAICTPQMFECYNRGSTLRYDKERELIRSYAYKGFINRTAKNEICQLWVNSHKWDRGKHTDHEPNARKQENMVAFGFHNYCRNFNYDNVFQPWCFVRKAHADHYVREICSVPNCHDCMFWKGYKKLTDKLTDQLYERRGDITVHVERDGKGRKVQQRCHVGTAGWHADNVCSVKVKGVGLSGRMDKPNDGLPYCLRVFDKSKLEDGKKDDHDVNWDNFAWEECTAPQCTVRQVWFLLFNTHRYIHFDSNNEEYVEVPCLANQHCQMRFLHFGTSYCDGMKLETEPGLEAFLHLITLMCKPTPQMSYIDIMETKAGMAGKYSLVYTFKEGNPILDEHIFKVNFKLEMLERTKVSLTSATLCRGYQASIQIVTQGSYKIIRSSIQWKYSYTGYGWKSAHSLFEQFKIASDGMYIVIKSADKTIHVQVSGSTSTNSFKVKREVKMLKTPKIILKSGTIEGKENDEVTLEISYDLAATSRWIFGGLIITHNTPNYYIATKVDTEKMLKVETLTIERLTTKAEGIYTTEVNQGGCIATEMIHVNIKKIIETKT